MKSEVKAGMRLGPPGEVSVAARILLMSAEKVERDAERSEASGGVLGQIPRCARNDNVQRFPLRVVVLTSDFLLPDFGF
jgi:class 3 adenylate cyclase